MKQFIMSEFFRNFSGTQYQEELMKYQRLETIFNYIEHQTRQINMDTSPLLPHKQAQRFTHHAIILPILLEELLVQCNQYHRILVENTENYYFPNSFYTGYQPLISKYCLLINQLTALKSHCKASTVNLINHLDTEKNASQDKSIASEFFCYIKQFLKNLDKYNDYPKEIEKYASQLNKIRNAGLKNAKCIKKIRAKMQVTQTPTDETNLEKLQKESYKLSTNHIIVENQLEHLLRSHKPLKTIIVNLIDTIKEHLLKNPSLIHPETDKLFELDSLQQFFNLAPISKKPPLTNSSQPTIRFA